MVFAYSTPMASSAWRHATAWAVIVTLVIVLESGTTGDSFLFISDVAQPITFFTLFKIGLAWVWRGLRRKWFNFNWTVHFFPFV